MNIDYMFENKEITFSMNSDKQKLKDWKKASYKQKRRYWAILESVHIEQQQFQYYEDNHSSEESSSFKENSKPHEIESSEDDYEEKKYGNTDFNIKRNKNIYEDSIGSHKNLKNKSKSEHKDKFERNI